MSSVKVKEPIADYLFDPQSVNLTPEGIPSNEPLYTFSADSVLFRLRPLCSTDYVRGTLYNRVSFGLLYYRFFRLLGYLDLLSQLTVTGDVTQQMYASE